MKNLSQMLSMVQEFHEVILNTPIPDKPSALSEISKIALADHLREELAELLASNMFTNQADALIDLIYVALGGLIKMGFLPGAGFEAVHEANMKKERGMVSKRPNSEGHDAIKPEGWKPADLEALFISLDDLQVLQQVSPVFKKVTELRIQKGKDYNSSMTINDYFVFGHKSYVQMVYLKALRLVSLVRLLDDNKKATFEGINDTIEDLINYACYYKEAIDNGSIKL